MKKAWLIAIAFIVSIPLGLVAQSDTRSDGYYALSYARLNYANGDVFVQRTADAGKERAEVNLVLVRSDKLGTGAGQAEVQLGRRNYLRLNDGTRVEFAFLPVAGDDRIKVHVLEGSACLRVGELAGDKAIEVHTPDASAYILEEGLYRFNVDANGQTEVVVLEGSLEAAGEEGSLVVRDHQSLFASDGRLLGEPADSSSGLDAFDRWNESRDALFAQRSSTRYMPSDIDEYEEELDQNGRWAYEQPYGYVWTPSGVDDDWRPYMYGRWEWYAGLGWNWISSEPWGWSVYHYGRWQWRFGLGWYWIPRHEWGPAWVHWWWDSDYIGWCPLSWYDRPGVIMGHNFYDRYRDNYFPGGNRAMSVIPRDRLQSGDVGRHMLRGGELDRLGRVQLQARQPDARQGVGRGSLQSPDARGIISSRSGVRSSGVSPSAGGIRTYPRDGSGTLSRGGSVSTERSMKTYGSSRSSAYGSSVTSGQGVRTYPSRSRDTSSSASPRSSSSERSFGARSSSNVRSYPSRLSEDQASGSRQARSYSGAGASSSSRGLSGTSRSSSYGQSQSPRYNPRTYSYSGPSSSSSSRPGVSSSPRSSESRYSAPSQSRGSFAAPSRSERSSSAPARSGGGGSSSAPRVSGSSSSSHSSSSSSSGHSAPRRK
jgi:hypothetical protein